MGARTSLACAASKFLVVARRCKPVLAVSGLVQVLVSTVVGVTRIPFSSDGSVYYQPGVDSVTEAARDANTLLSSSSFSPALTCRAHVSCLARSQEQTTQMVSACGVRACVCACVRACARAGRASLGRQWSAHMSRTLCLCVLVFGIKGCPHCHYQANGAVVQTHFVRQNASLAHHAVAALLPCCQNRDFTRDTVSSIDNHAGKAALKAKLLAMTLPECDRNQ
jgi:hypothetical protein